jgi:hypothetical protein
MSAEIVPIALNGAELLTVDVDGKPHIVFRPAVEALGLDYASQITKLRDRSWVNRRDIPTVAADGKTRVMATVDTTTFLMWLATVNEKRVAADIRPTLVAYQRETSDAVNAYWTKGGAINPSASADQLATIVGNVKSQLEILRLAEGLVDRHWLEGKVRHAIGRALGEEPEVEFANRTLTVGEYLKDKGFGDAALRSISTGFGKRLVALYRAKYGGSPAKVERYVDGALRMIYGYTETHRPLFDAVYDDVTADAT